MKLKFYFLTFMLLFSRGCDFYSTSLWFFQPNGMAGEMNPLTRYLGVGWNGLVITNAILIGLIIYAFYYFTFRYKHIRLTTIPDNLIDYVSVIYYAGIKIYTCSSSRWGDRFYRQLPNRFY